MKLIIIAAGEGSRIASVSGGIPKTLLRIDNKRLIDHLLDNCLTAGIEECVVITGYRSEYVQEQLTAMTSAISIQTVHNPDWKKPNGLSVLAAKPAIPEGEDFMISMSDHYYQAELLGKVKTGELHAKVANVGLDFNIDTIFDLEDGMKVRVDTRDPTVITGMSKLLAEYDAIDCGVFRCTYEFFDTLEASAMNGNCSLSDACNMLIPGRRMGGVNIGGTFWCDIDTPEAIRYCAERVKTPLRQA